MLNQNSFSYTVNVSDRPFVRISKWVTRRLHELSVLARVCVWGVQQRASVHEQTNHNDKSKRMATFLLLLHWILNVNYTLTKQSAVWSLSITIGWPETDAKRIGTKMFLWFVNRRRHLSSSSSLALSLSIYLYLSLSLSLSIYLFLSISLSPSFSVTLHFVYNWIKLTYFLWINYQLRWVNERLHQSSTTHTWPSTHKCPIEPCKWCYNIPIQSHLYSFSHKWHQSWIHFVSLISLNRTNVLFFSPIPYSLKGNFRLCIFPTKTQKSFADISFFFHIPTWPCINARHKNHRRLIVCCMRNQKAEYFYNLD